MAPHAVRQENPIFPNLLARPDNIARESVSGITRIAYALSYNGAQFQSWKLHAALGVIRWIPRPSLGKILK